MEIDDSKFRKRKYDGKFFGGKWVFGGVGIGNNKCFSLLWELHPRSIILTDIETHSFWTCNTSTVLEVLLHERFVHSFIKHSLNFVNTETESNTNSIEVHGMRVK